MPSPYIQPTFPRPKKQAIKISKIDRTRTLHAKENKSHDITRATSLFVGARKDSFEQSK